MNPSRRPQTSPLALLAALLLPGLAAAQAGRILAPDLLHPIRGLADPQAGKGFLRGQPVQVDFRILERVGPGTELRVELFQDTVFRARFEELRVERHLSNAYHWTGTLAGRPGSQFVITVVEGAFAATFYVNDPELQTLAVQGAPGMYVARELDDAEHGCLGSLNPPRGLAVPIDTREGSGPLSSCKDDLEKCEIMLVYDLTARSQAGGDTKIQAMIANAVVLANEVTLRKTMLPLRLVTKKILGIFYSATQTLGAELQRVTYKKGHPQDPAGYMDQVHTWRNTYGADIVGLVVGTTKQAGGGLAWCRPGWTHAFNVSVYTSLPAHILMHGIGHNFGCTHDRGNAGSCSPVASHGYGFWKHYRSFVNTRYYFHTVMTVRRGWGSCSFPYTCDHKALPYLSSPAATVTLPGNSGPGKHTLGTSTTDNMRIIASQRQRIANFSRFVQGYDKRPVITLQPRSTTRFLGHQWSPIIMQVAATGATRYQWKRNGRNIAGQTARTLVIRNITSADAGNYTCTVRGPCDTVPPAGTARAKLTVDSTKREGAFFPKLPQGKFGYDVSRIGDFDGDRYEDFAIGHPAANSNSLAKSGEVHVYSGRTHALLGVFGGFKAGEQLGFAITGADVDQDGRSDLIAGAPFDPNGFVRVISGRTKKQIRALTKNRGRGIGRLVATGHLDADGHPDILYASSVFLYASSGKSGTFMWRVALAGPRALDVIGDVNADGYDDIVVGMGGHEAGRGKFVVLSGKDGATLVEKLGAAGKTEGVGNAVVAFGGDIDGDNVPDFAVGAPGATSGRGAVTFWSGRRFRVIRTKRGGTANQKLGAALAAAGDVNRDGVRDLLVTSNIGKNWIDVFSGKDGSKLRPTIQGQNAFFGMALDGIDANADGTLDILIGDQGYPPHGGTWLADAGAKADPPRITLYGATCPGTGGRLPRMGHVGLPRIGGPLTLTVGSARGSSIAMLSLGLRRTSLPMDALGMTGCKLQILSTVLSFIVPTDTRGYAAFRLPLPNDTGIVGATTNWQWFPLDIGGNKFGMTMSNAAAVRIGAK